MGTVWSITFNAYLPHVEAVKPVSTLKRSYELIGAAFGLGSDNKGTLGAPAALRAARVLERLRRLGVQVESGIDIALSPEFPLERDGGNPKLRNLPAMHEFARLMMPALRAVYGRGAMPVVLGGDHALSMVTISVAAEVLKQRHGPDAELGVLWVDAHGDVNTADTTPSGNLHGMPGAVLMGSGEPSLVNLSGFSPKVKPENFVLMGVRDLDPGEKEYIRSGGITAYTMKDIDMWGIGEIARRAFAQVSRATKGVVVSFDMDVCDPNLAPAVGTPVRGGFTFREAHLVMEMAAELPSLMSVELVEFNPALDNQSLTCELAISLLESALGKSIL
ncbi:MAG: arginase [Proteobacteria bacterium]|nr:arginase [Pseudomonadota bacterium]